MTNKEAIEELVNLDFYARPFDNSIEASIEANNKIEAVRLAIKALEFIDENFPKTFIDYLNGEQI
jgi:hypothetical protein